MPHQIILALLALSSIAAPILKYDAPAGWVSKPPASTMRVAEFTLPKVAGDAEDAALAIYYFGTGQGGTVQANLDRWMSQMAQPDGTPSKDVAKTTTLTSRGLKITVVDVSGTYVAELTPGSTERHNKPGFRQLAAVVETTSGPYFVKLTGPARTIAKWADSYTTFLKSIRLE